MLNRHEKFAIFNISIVLLAVMIFFIIYLTVDSGKSYGAFGLIGFTALEHMFFKRKKNAADVVEDERDKSIKLKSETGGYSFALAYLILTSSVIYFLNVDAGVVPVHYVILLAWSGWVVYLMASSVIILVQYRRGTSCGTC